MICGTTINPDRTSEDQEPSVRAKVCPASGSMEAFAS